MTTPDYVPALLVDVPAPCPPWCTGGDDHTPFTGCTEDVRHQGPTLPPFDVAMFDGSITQLLRVELIAWAGNDGAVRGP